MTTDAAPRPWGIDNDCAPLHDVLLGAPEHYRWVEAGPLIGRTLDNAHVTGARFDLCQALRREPRSAPCEDR